MSRFRIDRMSSTAVAIANDDGIVVARCHVATRWTARLVGLLATADLRADEGVWLAPCRSVHTWGMRISIACAFVDRDGRVLRVIDPLPPRRTAAVRGASAVLETRAGGLARVRVGDVLRHARGDASG